MIYEILDDNGKVVNRIIADQSFVEAYHEGHYRLIGSEQTPYIAPIITKLAFRFRMTDAEYVAILAASKTDVEIAAWVETFNMVNQINLDDDRTKSGVSTLVAKNLLTNERANEILTAEVQPNERP